MGGRALMPYGIETRRYNDDEYRLLCDEVISMFNSVFPNNKFGIVKAYHNKDSHGDMDVIMKCSMYDNHNAIVEKTKDLFKPNASTKNDNVFSFDYKDFQIDLIFAMADYYDYMYEGMCYDPTLNLMGKIYHKFGVSYKHSGLYYVLRSYNGRVAKDILLTRDSRKTFEFGGFDYDRYLQGFDELEEIFEFIITSKYFNFELFKFENLTQKDRKRNRKRSTYNQFIQYCNEKLHSGYDILEDRSELYEGKNRVNNTFEFSKDKSIYLEKVNDFFPEVDIYTKIENFRKKDGISRECADKFNGKLVMSLHPDLMGKELGSFMQFIKKSLGVNNVSESLVDVLHPMTQDEIIDMINKAYKEFKNV